jgi:putative hydrolase of the HAD superfamily
VTGRVGTLFVDAGGVLVDPDWERVAAVLSRHGIDAAPGALAAAEPAAKAAIDVPPAVLGVDDRRRGGLFFRALVRAAGIAAGEARMDAADLDLREEHRRRNLWTVVPEGAPGALDRLRAAGLGLVLVSNADPDLPGVFEDLGLARRFDHLVISGIVGVEKPDPGIFREALRVSGADPSTTVHVGDLYEVDVVGARAAGIGAVLVDPGGTRAGRDCPRVPSLAAYVDALLA